MSPRTAITTLNLGSQSLELAVFCAQPSGELTLCGYRSRDLPADPAEEGTRKARVAAALREMQCELRIKSGPVNYSVAEELIFTRFIELPPVDAEKIARLVSFEAQQNVPFPIDEVVWDYQQVGSGRDKQIQVILAAIKTDLIEEINAAVESTGLRTSIVDLATTALYNAFRYNYRDLAGCSLLVDIGARTTNLIFIEPGKMFTRSVPIGGSSVTAAIAKEFNEPFAAAELRKRRNDASQSSATLEFAIADAALVSQIVRGTMVRLHAEVQRSINHYCAQQQGQPPERIFLSGGGAGAHSIRDFFREKLPVPTELFNPLRNIIIADSADREEIVQSAHLLGEPVGLALRASADCSMKLNLCPRSVVRRSELERRWPSLITAAACVILCLLAWWGYYAVTAHLIRHQAVATEEKAGALHRIEAQLNQVHRQTAELDRVAAPLIAAINDRGFWLQTIEELNARLPKENIWITELVATTKGTPINGSDGRMSRVPVRPASAVSTRDAGVGPPQTRIDGILVRGLYLFNAKQQEVAIDYFRNLVDSSWFAVDPRNQAKTIKPTTPNETEWAFPYELHLDLRQPVTLP